MIDWIKGMGLYKALKTPKTPKTPEYRLKLLRYRGLQRSTGHRTLRCETFDRVLRTESGLRVFPGPRLATVLPATEVGKG